MSFSTGCSNQRPTFASMNPFSRATIDAPKADQPSMTESIASTATGAKDQVSAVGVSAKNAIGKTTDAIAGVFRRDSAKDAAETSDTDPLRLTDEPATVGPEVLVANGQLWESTGNFQKAMESYNKALEKTPNDSAALTSIARLHFRQGNHAKATEYFQLAIKQSPGDAALYNDLGLTLSKTGNHDEAAKMIAKSLELAPGTSRYANNLASVLFESNKKQEALQVLMQNNKPAVANFNMAYLHYSKGQMNEARGFLSETLKFDAQGASDAAVKKAVERSREMLAQIDASRGVNPAQAPVEKIAAQPPQTQASVAQAAGAPANGTTDAAASIAARANADVPAAAVSYRPAATTWAPSTATGNPNAAATTPASPAVPSYSTPSFQPATLSVNPKATAETTPGTWPTTPGAAAKPAAKPVQPAAEKPADSEASSPSGSGFQLPHGFQFPESH
ncbi:tetratricopeptide repeat protein [Novipirellula caenicola]|uniref:tetratricopeptide repeat protein n=1 Tax=Novipirellula caenicola TaxID=1536901 RepID=UPI0031E991B5